MIVTIDTSRQMIPMKLNGLTLVELTPKNLLGKTVYSCRYEEVKENTSVKSEAAPKKKRSKK